MEEWNSWLLICLACLILSLSVHFTWKFSSKIQLFPLKGRAPRFVVIQLVYFIMLNFIPLLTEIFLRIGVNWKKESTAGVPLTREFLKSFYSTMRLSCYLIYIHR